MGVEMSSQSFAQRVGELLKRVEYRRADSSEDKAAIFRMRHKAYVSNGSIEPRADEMFSDEFDETPNAWLIAVFIDGELASSIRIHIASDSEAAFPAMRPFPDIIGPRLNAGLRLMDASRHVNRLEFTKQYPEMPLITMRPGFLAERFFDINYLVGACRAENQNAFRRMLGVSQWAPPRSYPGLTGQWALMAYDCEVLRPRTYSRYPFYQSNFDEQLALFGRSSNSSDDYRMVMATPALGRSA